MGQIHQLILNKGRQAARDMVATKHEKSLIDVAAQFLAEEEEHIGITHSGFCLTALPHKATELLTWRREGYRCTLVIQSGVDRQEMSVGLPFGSKARMILLYLQTQAVRTRSPVVELGGSMHRWLETMGLSIGGNTYRQVAEQALRISRCRLTFFWDGDAGSVELNGGFVKTAIRPSPAKADSNQPSLWRETVELDEAFYQELLRHPVPLSENALKAISGKSMALDIYIWLAYRLHAIEQETPISWPSVHRQFGAGFAHLRQFKPEFIRNLQLAMAVYPEARVSVEESGLILRPSKSPIRALSRS